MSEEPVYRDERGRLMPGSTLNPNGKPKGALSLAGQMRKALAADVPEILASVVQQAKDGDLQAARLVLERVVPALRAESPAQLIPDAAEGRLTDRARAVFRAAALGEIGTDAALQLIGTLVAISRLVEVEELTQRISRLEAGGPSR